MFRSTLSILSVALVAASLVIAAPISSREVPSGLVENKRVAFTDFSSGTTACGDTGDQKYNDGNYLGVDSSFGSDYACGRKVRITAPNGQVHVGTVIDTGAENEALNLSPGLFKKFYKLDKGIFTGNYEFI